MRIRCLVGIATAFCEALTEGVSIFGTNSVRYAHQSEIPNRQGLFRGQFRTSNFEFRTSKWYRVGFTPGGHSRGMDM